ncbi:MAG: hypothetical protein ACM3Q2_13305 [Syntrophothermus sp.]
MMYRIIIIWALLITALTAASERITAQAEPGSEMLDRIRNEFYLAIEDEDALNGLIRFIESSFSEDPAKYPAVILAYSGVLETLKAKHTYNPYSKFKYVTAGLKKLNKAVSMSSDMLEVRFLRFAVLHNIPGIFGVADDRRADLKESYKLLLRQDYSSISRNLQRGIAEFLLKSGRLDQAQTEILKREFPDAQTE